MKIKEKDLLRNYKFRDYLKQGGYNRREFKALPLSAKQEIVKHFTL